MRTSRLYLAFLCVLAVCANAVAQTQGAKENRQPNEKQNSVTSEAVASNHAAAQIEKFARLVAGTWDLIGYSAPGTPPKHDSGRTEIRFGPGKRSLIEQQHTNGDSGKIDALGVFWWDDNVQGYRTMFCAADAPNGCAIYNGVGKWEGNAVVFHFVERINGVTQSIKQVVSSSGRDSFTAVFFHGDSEETLKPAYTWRHTRRPSQ
jgi:hypothetical protein